MTDESRDDWMKWARFRFSVIGGLLASPPPRGHLGDEIENLSRRTWQHPIRADELMTIGASTIERWYYQARAENDPVAALRRKVRSDAGRNVAMGAKLLEALHAQYVHFSHFSFQLHYDNLVELVREDPSLGPMPSYSTVCRRMQQNGWLRRKRPRTEGQRKAQQRLDEREVRSYEAAYVHGLWHTDFHECKRKVVDASGEWYQPDLMCVIDDRSRLCCHIQWYDEENTENLVHGLKQALLKRGVPRELMSDNGKAMIAAETTSGLDRLGILHDKTLAYSAYQNGKQETLWEQVEGRLMAMVCHVAPLTLEFLNRATSAWAEHEYNRRVHSELGCTPLERFMEGPDVGRDCPGSADLALAFCVQKERTLRRSDCTLSIGGVRFEVPSRFRHLRKLSVRYARWNLSVAWIVDPRTDDVLARILPLDKSKNADGRRRSLDPVDAPETDVPPGTIPPLMRRLLADQQASGLPPAYIPKHDDSEEDDDE